MKRRRQNQRRAAPVEVPPPEPPTIAGAWENLPDALLLSVLDRLLSLRDLLAAAAVCRTWRGLARLSFSDARRPPLLLRPTAKPSRRGWYRSQPLRCELLCPADPCASWRSSLSAEATSRGLVGFSHGYLIFCTANGVFLADAFAPDVVRTAELPCAFGFQYGLLTAPISSPHSRLLLVSRISILVLRFSDRRWTHHFFKSAFDNIDHIVVFKNQCFALNHDDRMFVLKFSPEFSKDQFVVQWEEDWNRNCYTSFKRQLVQCGDELMLVQLCLRKELIMHANFAVHRLDFSSSPPKWVKVENLGDWALFIDYAGRSPVACSSPGIWGGRSNCIYYTSPGCGTWCEFLMDSSTTIDTSDPESPFYVGKQSLRIWPSPLWVYPIQLSS